MTFSLDSYRGNFFESFGLMRLPFPIAAVLLAPCRVVFQSPAQILKEEHDRHAVDDLEF